MKLGLLGYPILHSLSPKIYQDLLGAELESYDLLNLAESKLIPNLEDLSTRYDGLNITAPYKKHFLNDVIIESELVKKIGAINTLAFRDKKVFATNTDFVATEKILKRLLAEHKNIQLILLGNGSMAKLTKIIANDLSIPFTQLFRTPQRTIDDADLRPFEKDGIQTIVINSCSRSFIFKGLLSKNSIFWDYNYLFEAHRSTIPQQVLLYQDGQEMLLLQAQAAIEFWRSK